MTYPAATIEPCYVHVQGPGAICCARGSGPSVNYDLAPADFAEMVTNEAVEVRMLGSAENAELIADLFPMLGRAKLESVHLISPILMKTRADRKEAGKVFLSMRCAAHGGTPASLGGWHEMTRDDWISYEMAARTSNPSRGKPEALLVDHPAWPGLSIIKHLNPAKVSELIGVIRDPRWYVQASDPDRDLLLAYLGIATGRAKPRDAEVGARTLLALRAWCPESGDETTPPVKGSFLSRYRSKLKPERADAATTRHFVTYLRLIWNDALTRSRFPWFEGWFVPEYFFTNPIDVAIYKAAVGR